jgi:hypothetical protein
MSYPSYYPLVRAIPGLGALGEEIGVGAAKRLHPVRHKQSTLSLEYEAVLRSAEKYHINPVILWGVYGAETSHGGDVKTSSTGARGPFQFEPATAKAYGYPLNANVTGVTNLKAFQQQSDSAAHYLASLLPGGKGEVGLKRGKTWEAAWESALRHYSGGGYGLALVKQRGSAAKDVIGAEASNLAETAHVEEGPAHHSLLEEIEKFALTAALLIVGAVLVIYGIMVAVRPRERAFSVPVPA